ncbi:MAG: hypothetical protein ACQESR_02645, partial [Planctomycetota bacterium]
MGQGRGTRTVLDRASLRRDQGRIRFLASQNREKQRILYRIERGQRLSTGEDLREPNNPSGKPRGSEDPAGLGGQL